MRWTPILAATAGTTLIGGALLLLRRRAKVKEVHVEEVRAEQAESQGAPAGWAFEGAGDAPTAVPATPTTSVPATPTSGADTGGWWPTFPSFPDPPSTIPTTPTMADYEAAISKGRSVRLGQHFNLAEFLTSTTARTRKIANIMPPEEEGNLVANLRALVLNVLDPIRNSLGPVTITGGWRGPALNDSIGGSRLCTGHGFPANKAPSSAEALRLGCGSQHLLAEGADIRVRGFANSKDLAKAIYALKTQGKVNYDQMVWYDPDQSGHVHLSWTRRRSPRGDVRRKMASGYVSQLPTVA